MKEWLRQIYSELSNGSLSQTEALEKIKALKEQGPGVLLAAPAWHPAPVTAGATVYGAHHVLLCERPAVTAGQLQATLPHSRFESLQAAAQQPLAERYGNHALAVAATLRAVIEERPQGKTLIQLVVADSEEQALFAGLSGLLRTATLENPAIAGQLLLVPAGITAEELSRYLAAEKTGAADPVVRYANGVRQILQWEEVAEERAESSIAFKDQGIYLITGGLGGLGLLFAKEIFARASQAHVVLTGRSPLTDETRALLNDLSPSADRLSYRQADVADAAQVEQLIAAIREEHGRLDGILHSAGIVADRFILTKSDAEFSAVLAPKVAGTCNLDQATHDLKLDFFVLFSSVIGAFGNPGQGAYAAANAFLDRFAAWRNRQVAAGLRYGRTRSINWPIWQDGGMVPDPANGELLQQSTGMRPMRTATGLQAFHRSLALPGDQLLVMEGNLAEMRKVALTGRPLEAEVSPVAPAPAAALDAESLFEKTQEYLRRQSAELLKLPYHRIDPEAALETYGIDSILAMKLTGHLELTFGALSKTLFFEYQTLSELARYFAQAHSARLETLFAAKTGGTNEKPIGPIGPIGPIVFPSRENRRSARRRTDNPATPAAQAPAPQDEPIAIIGLSGRYPEAVDLQAYWQNLRDGKDCIIEVPKERWDWRTYYNEDRTQPGYHYSKWGGFIAGVDEFDPLFFNISPKEAKHIDPQERLFLQHAWMAIEDAGYTRAGLQVPHAGDLPGQAGVYVGVMYTEYQLLGLDASTNGNRLGIGSSAASIANRVSYALNLHGPSMALDTMCSSSLTAIHIACQDLKQGRTSLAIAGGVNVSIHPNKYLMLSAGQFISSDGHCQSFGEGGDGYIPGEGVGVVVLKRLSEAERDGDHIYGVIRGSALNHGGKTNGYTVPNPQAQASAIARALSESKTDARHVSYIEAHGTGTKLGDPIEIAALTKAFSQYTKEAGFCPIGSAKSNIGHCESAAGIAGLTKVLLQMEHQELVPSLHSAELNPHIDFAATPFVVNQQVRPWAQPVIDGQTQPRIAGISSFGAGGANAHLIVEEYQVPAARTVALPEAVVVLSARTPEQLRQKAADLLAYLRPRIDTLDLAATAWTLQTGREAMDERLAFVVTSAGQLAEKLQAYVSGRQGLEDVYEGQVKRNREALSVFSNDADLQQTIDRWIASRKLAKLVDVWVKGLDVDWKKLYGGVTPRRVSLPVYPFARDRYWIELPPPVAPAPAKQATAAVLHPLLHRNTSDLRQQSYSSTFSGDESFLRTSANGQTLLPPEACLEMARAAIERAATIPDDTHLELHDVAWGEPVAVTPAIEVCIALLPRDEEEIGFEIYSREGERETVHCQGRAVLQHGASPVMAVEEPTAPAAAPLPARATATPARTEVTFLPPVEAVSVAPERKKRPSISLATPGASVPAPSAGRAPITLVNAALRVAAAVAPAVRLFDDGQGLFSIRLEPSSSPRTVIAQLKQALAKVQDDPSTKVLLIAGLEQALPRGRETHDEAVAQGLYGDLASFPYPVIAVLHGDTLGASFLTAALCGLMVCSEEAAYAFTDAQEALHPAAAELALFSARFGHVRAQDLLYVSRTLTGRELQARGWTCPVLPRADVETYARQLAATLTTKSREALRLLKQHLTRNVAVPVAALRAVEATLPAPAVVAQPLTSPSPYIRVAERGDGVVVIRFDADVQAKDVVPGLRDLLTAMQQQGDGRAVVLASIPADLSYGAVLELQPLLAASRSAVVAAFDGDASGNAWLLGQLCHATVYSSSGTYSAAGLAPAAAAAFTHRFGSDAGREFLLTGDAYSGAELQQRAGSAIVAGDDQVLSTAVELAAALSRSVVAQQPLFDMDSSAAPAPPDSELEAADVKTATPIPLQSSVVTATAHPDGIVVVTMEDRVAKNMFSEALVEGMQEAFANIERMPACKVVILTGFDSYFASGGTKETLLAIHEGKARFTDVKVFQFPLDCALPVIAAMQGHGIGAGWALGMFADAIVLSEESRYVSPYMDYGFTPGAGATWIIGDKLGEDIARESLLTAQQYTGGELRARGVRLPVVSRNQVVPAALALARKIARAPRHHLIALKQQFRDAMQQPLAETYRRELAMHEQTFVGKAATLAQIETNFAAQDVAGQALLPVHRDGVHGDGGQAGVPVLHEGNAGQAGVSVPHQAGQTDVSATVRTLLANELQMRESDIDDNTQFIDLGLDSIGGVAWVRKINEKYRTSIEATRIYSYPTLSQFARYVEGEAEKQGTLVREQAAPAAAAPVVAPAPKLEIARPGAGVATPPIAATSQKLTSWRSGTASRFGKAQAAARTAEPIAVIGLAGQFPRAKNLEEFWQNIADGRNCITPVSPERWDLDAYYQPGGAVAGKTYSRWLGALEEYDRFDPLFFNISPREAESIDPQQRLFLQACWHSIESAGYDARSLSGSKCGVFVGCAFGDYHLLSRTQQLSAEGFTGDATSILAARISYFLNLRGPCVSIDTACSSSLVAIADACDSLLSGASDLALAGGVYVMAGPEMHIKTAQAGMLSADGQCYTFDQRANGFVMGEGVGVVLLKRLADAQRDGDIIHAVIEGWGINQDGKTNGITAPNPESQTRLQQDVYDRYGIDPAGIQLIEAHGTGTKLGDPIEVEGLKNAFAKYTQEQQYCALGSVKSNIGHCLTAAGIAGVQKLILALRHKQLPPTVNFERVNEHIDLTGSPFYVNGRLQDWTPAPGQKRRSAISSFGFSGTNVHLVIGEYVPPPGVARRTATAVPGAKTIVPLSARTAEQLKQKVLDLLAFVRRETASLDLAELAYTLQAGREPMEERLGFVVSSIDELAEKLQAYADGVQPIADAFRGEGKRTKATLGIISQDTDLQQSVIEKWRAEKKLAKLLELWVNGIELDWNAFYGEARPRRILLPLYPFAKERYWIEPTAQRTLAAGKATAVIHPLLHSNISDLSEQRYGSTFTGDEFFLADHQVQASGEAARKVLPGVAYLEMARAAIEQALPKRADGVVLELQDVVWVQPIVVDGARQVSIALATDEQDRIVFEVYSGEGDAEVVHCQGRAVLSREPATARLDIEQLRREMGASHLEPGGLYAAWRQMGLLYGPSFRGVTDIHRGSGQLLAQLRLPEIAGQIASEYVLHPSLMDSGMQSCVGLLAGDAGEPRLPFALETLRIVAPCTTEMVAWVRYAAGSHAADHVVKFDLDLCDASGNVCVQMRGLSSRKLSAGAVVTSAAGAILAVPAWRDARHDGTDETNGTHGIALEPTGPMGSPFTAHQVALCELAAVDIDDLSALLLTTECVALHARGADGLAERYSAYALGSFEQIRTILEAKPQGRVLVQIVVPADGEQAVFAGLSGLLKTAALENPNLTGQLLLAPMQTSTEDLARWLEAEKTTATDAVVRYDGGRRQVLRWEEIPSSPAAAAAFKDRGVYLITGGLGALGLVFAKEILERTAGSRVVLTGRSPLTPQKQALLDALGANKRRASYRRVDLGELRQVEQLVDMIIGEHGSLDGILHCAGRVADNFILRKSAGEFAEVLGPKVTGTCHLDHASRHLQLDFFVLFSSFAGAIGNVGQADYAAANAFLDHFAAHRNRQVAAGERHGRTRSINWPLWQAGGMRIDAATQEVLERTMGVQPMQSATGLQAFHHSLALAHDQVLVAEGDTARLRAFLFGSAERPVEAATPASAVAVSADGLAEKTQEYLRKELAGLLKVPAHRIDPEAPWEKYGIDSILALKLTTQLEQTFGSLPKTLFFEYRTMAELTRYFAQAHAARLSALVAAPAAKEQSPISPISPIGPIGPIGPIERLPRRHGRSAVRRPAQAAASHDEPIAIIGLSGRYPEAVDLAAYWNNLRDGRDCITEVPKSRWDWRAYFSEDRTEGGHHYSKWGGFIAGVDEFDALFFNISPKEAKQIDPQERLFLQHAWMAIEDAGYTRATLQVPQNDDLAGQVGVYAGVMYSEYQLFGAEASALGTRIGVAGSAASIANRVSYALNLHGPSMTLDTMCSSSLTAIHVACQDLKLGRTSLALAGGVNVSIHPNKYLVLSAGQFISSDGHCQSFGEGGDGYIPGEGVGVVVLKRLSDAKRDGDHIYGVIRGSALNHGGKTNGYTVPNPQAQASAIGRALAESKTDARHVSYIEAHGTGTKLGDPIEIAALTRAFQHYTKDTGFCLIGSAKSNIGHCESAAGIAGLTKILLQMQHRQLVPSLHSAQLNPHIEFESTPFVVNQELRSWEPPVIDGRQLPRIAGLSSFGAGGSNAHLLIEEYAAPAAQPAAGGNVAILLSARTPEQLLQKAQDLLDFVRPRLSTLDLVATAYTLQAGREAMDERLGFVVSSPEELVEKLRAYVAGEQGIDGAYQGQAKRKNESLSAFSTDTDLQQTVDKWIANRKFSKLLDLWVKGLELDWTKLYGETRPSRVSLPVYPFAKERCWLELPAVREVAATQVASGFVHPLVHSNTSDLNEQRYSSTFTGEELFLEGSHGARRLASAAYLEMARAAIADAFPAWCASAMLELREHVWSEPVVVTGNQPVSIALVANDRDEIDYEIYSGDTVHCHGRGVLSYEAPPSRLDLAQLGGGGDGQLLAKLALPQNIAATTSDYVLHPAVIEGALQAAGRLFGGPAVVALETLRILAPCSSEMVAWVRSTSDAAVDIDVCDPQGNVAVQLRGVTMQAARFEVAAPVVTAAKAAAAVVMPLTRKEIVLATQQQPVIPAERKKRAAILLAAPGAVGAQRVAARAPIALSTPSLPIRKGGPDADSVRLFDEGNGRFTIRVNASSDAVPQLLQALARVQPEPALKVLTLEGLDRAFTSGSRDDYNSAIEQGLYRALASFAYPIIAVLEGDAAGAAFMAAALCDFMVCSEEAACGFTHVDSGLLPTTAEALLFAERFGEPHAHDLLYVAGPSTAKQLRAKGWTFPIVAGAEVKSHGEQLAASLVSKSRDALRLLKEHLTRRLAVYVNALAPIAPQTNPDIANPKSEIAALTATTFVELVPPANGVLVLKLAADASARELLADLRGVFAEVNQDASCKAIVLSSRHPEFLPPVSGDVLADVQRLLADSPVPIVAALSDNASGNGWLVAQFCEAAVYSRTGSYSSANALPAAVPLFARRFGNQAASELLLIASSYSGAVLAQRTGTVTAVERPQVLPAAIAIAERWTQWPRTTLAAWKQHTAATIVGQEWRTDNPVSHATHDASTPAPVEQPAEQPAPSAGPIVLRSNVVTATVDEEGIIVVKMEDRQAKNMFSDAFIDGLNEVFARIESTPACKVVVLTGYDSYFASGGTKDGLLAIQQGKAKFTDLKIFQLPFVCKVPVIAAMQGHGIGAGWTLGMFADVVLLSDESRYVSPYMDYGFTPGAGATAILAAKMGADLARESLFTARYYTGSDLKARGLRLPILPRAEVVSPAAMTLARQIARASRPRLVALKQQLTAGVRESIEETYRLEVAMHEQTFVGQAATLAQIESNFHEEAEPAPVIAPPRPAPPQPAAAPRTSDGDVLRTVTAGLRTLLANELQMRESDIDENAQFVDLGLDSISGVTWIRKINEKYETSIEATKVYSFPTLTQLSRHVREEAEKHGTLSRVAAAPIDEAPAVERPAGPVSRTSPQLAIAKPRPAAAATTRRRRRAATRVEPVAAPAPAAAQPIAVIGMAGQFPQAKNLDEFWQNIADGRNCIAPVPANRWDLNAFYQPGDAVPGKTNSQWLGALDGVDLFDPLFFNISPTEAESMDPQQRLFLQACWHTIENAGYDSRVLSGSRCGVFVGCAATDYHQLSRQHQLSAQGFTGGAMSILAARISYFLNLQGASVAIDTACSSSLVAIAQACDTLSSGGSDLALAGGVCVMAGPEMHIKTAQAGMLSPEGKCFTFDQRADGFVPGEGVGVVMLKRLADAERDGDIIYGVIEGWGVNQDGRSNGITAPNAEAQTRLEQEVYDHFGIDPNAIQLIEAHGTGTKLGDPIEVEGLKNAFGKYTQKNAYCALGSIKSNIGHCLTAAGIAGVMKLILALKHRQLPPTINFERLNEHIDLTNSPFFVNERLQEWKAADNGKRQAAISSFGFSGTNVHMVIGEYRPAVEAHPLPAVPPNATTIVPLSARTTEQLKQKALDLIAFIRSEPSRELRDIAYTLQAGRSPMDERAGFVVSTIEELTAKLQAFADGEQRIDDVYQGQVKRNRDSLSALGLDEEMKETLVDRLLAQQKLPKLLELWVKGLELQWNRLYDEPKPRRISLPVYPFAKERYWIEAPAAKQGGPRGTTTARLHPSLRRKGLASAVAHRARGTAATTAPQVESVFAAPAWVTGDVAISTTSGMEYREHHVVSCELPNVDSETLQTLLPDSHCLSLLAAEHQSVAARCTDHAVAIFEYVQAILSRKPAGRVLMHVVVSGEHDGALFAGLSALLKTAALESPQFTGQLMIVPPQTTTAELAGRLDGEKSRTIEPVIRYGNDTREVLRWQELAADAAQPPVAFKDGGVYLITGGFGALGTLFAKEILEQTRNARIVLTGRSAWSAEKQAVIDGWSSNAGQVSYRQVELSDDHKVQQLIAFLVAEHGRLDGILHVAGMLADNMIVKKTGAEFRAVLAPKVAGALNLDAAIRHLKLDFFVLFSSIAGALGNPGQADYATANGFLDQFAAYRNRQVTAGERYGRTRSIDWPLWQAGGMKLDIASQELVRQTTGIEPMRTTTGLQTFYRSLALPHDQTLIAEGSKAKIAAFLRNARIFAPAASTAPAAPAQRAAAATPAVTLAELQQQLKVLLGTVLRIEPSVIDADQPLVDLGLDSFLGAELVVSINKKYGTELSHIRLYDYPTIRELSLFLEQELAKMPAPAPEPAVSERMEAAAPVVSAQPLVSAQPRTAKRLRIRKSSSAPAAADDRIAIVGMSGRYPKAEGLKQYWENLAAGKNAITEVPESRWDMQRYYDADRTRAEKTYSKWMGAIDDVDCFDARFFRISPQEAEYMDPQHRLFLQESYRAFEDAGYCSTTLSNKRCGVYLGISTNDYTSLLLQHGVLSAPVTSNSFAIAAARIAYYLNLKGPALSVDTACSASLVAIHLASQAFARGEIDMALVGGVSLWLSPEAYVSMSAAGMFSATGQCKTFDDGADGIVNGEGVGALVLKRLKDAEADGDHIYGVILASGINQDGKTNGITAPSISSQIELERELYAKHEIDPDTITYVEAHGTGTRLGDPIELEALATVFKEKTARKNFCAIGSVKSNIGHTTAAAGVAGLQKVLLSMRHRTLVPTLNVKSENSRFDFGNSPFYISRETKPWDVAPDSLRRAAVSSFGFSGTNAHLVIEEHRPAARAATTGGDASFIIPLSARTAEQLRQRARDLRELLLGAEQPVDLAAVAWTLQIGRDAMEERAGFIVGTAEELAGKLAAFDAGATEIDGLYRGRVEPGQDRRGGGLQEVIDNPKLLELWVKGQPVDWTRLYAGAKPRRIPLPTYPFARDRYWITESALEQRLETEFALDPNMKSIEDIINAIGDDTLDTTEAVRALKLLV
ncbi:MAG TPA: SDR family NAD(P)-dependent oxidoreductase [Thermoanaerobaculia bacterium]